MEARQRSLERLERHRAGDVGRPSEPTRARQPERGHRRHELRAVDQREPLLRLRAAPARARRRRAPRRPAAARRRRTPPPRRRAAARDARAGRGRRSRPTEPRAGTYGTMPALRTARSSSTVSTRAPEYPFAIAFARSSIAARTTSSGIRLADAAGVAAQQAQLQLLGLLLRDRLRDEAAEAGVDPVGVLAPEPVDERPRALPSARPRSRRARPSDPPTATSQTSSTVRSSPVSGSRRVTDRECSPIAPRDPTVTTRATRGPGSPARPTCCRPDR